MRRLMLAGAAAVVLVGGGYAGAAITAPAPAAPHVSGSSGHHKRTTTCGDLRDGKGTGSALSAKPGQPVNEGQIATVQSITNTWRVCYDFNTGKLWLASSPGNCLADFGGHGIWEGCGGGNDEIWTEFPQSGGGFELRDTTGGVNLDICPTDGVGSQVIATGRQGCSTYHRVWLFN